MKFQTLLLTVLSIPLLAVAQTEELSKKYDVDSLPNDHYGRLVRYGKHLSEKTYEVIGPEVADKKCATQVIIWPAPIAIKKRQPKNLPCLG